VSAIAACFLALGACSAQPVVFGIHYGSSRQKFDGLHWYTVSFGTPVRDWGRWTLSHSVEAGRIEDKDGEGAALLSWGPGMRYHLPRSSGTLSFDFVVKPTYLTGRRFNGDDIGGRFHFSSHAGIGWHFDGVPLQVDVRYLHVSNAGTRSTNPGVNFAIAGLMLRF
jgi:hypothetical protein